MSNAKLVGQKLGKYKIVKQIGRGGMAEVYQAYQENLDRHVAIKVMHSFLIAEQDFLHRFKREARATAALTHPNIVRIYDFDVHGNDNYFLVMEYFVGGTLKEKLEALSAKNDRLPLQYGLNLIQEIAEALAYAHSLNMVHRDIKPANIMLNEQGRAVLTDFGIVKMMAGQSINYTATGALLGTPAYMSPEQAMGKEGDERVDVYSLGVLLFQIVTGQLPFAADTPLAVVMKHVNDPTPLPVSFYPDIPMDVQEIILKAMAKKPEERYQSAAEMASALRSVDFSKTTFDEYAQAPPEATILDGAVESEARLTTAVIDKANETAVAEAKAAPTKASITGSDTVLSPTAGPTIVSQPTTDVQKRRRPKIFYALIGLVALLIIAGAALFLPGLLASNQGQTDPDQVSDSTVEPAPTGAQEATLTSRPVTDTPSPQNTLDSEATERAAAALAATAENTASPTPTSTATPSPTATTTPDLTAEFLATCLKEVTLLNAYTYRNSNFNSAPVGATFPVNWQLRNSGTCPWPAELEWTYVQGYEFDFEGEPIALEVEILADEGITLTTSFVAPDTPGSYTSSWQLLDPEGLSFGSPITFTLGAYVPATPTPVPTNTPEASPTPETYPELNYLFEVQSCSYIGSDWECRVRITPYGGAGGPYSVFVFDQPAGQATTFRGGGPIDYFAKARRCANFNSNVRVIDDGVTPALEFNRHLFVDPDNYIEGGCVES